MGTFIDITGRSFGRLTAIRPEKPSRHGDSRWLFRCGCGTEKIIVSALVRYGRTISCGCHRAAAIGERSRTHGESNGGTAEHRAWSAMLNRCRGTGPKHARDYTARGITVCERWTNSFEAFLADMGRRPSERHSLDRINNDGNYEPGNCRWATAGQQTRNSRHARMFTRDGVTLCLLDWCARMGVPYKRAHARLRIGWTFEEAVEIVPRAHV